MHNLLLVLIESEKTQLRPGDSVKFLLDISTLQSAVLEGTLCHSDIGFIYEMDDENETVSYNNYCLHFLVCSQLSLLRTQAFSAFNLR